MMGKPKPASMQSTIQRLLAKAHHKCAHCLKQCKVKISLLDSRAMSHFKESEDKYELTRPSDKTLALAFGQTNQTTNTALQLMSQVHETMGTHILPVLDQNLLTSVKVLANNGCTMISHPYQKDIMVHDDRDVNITVIKAALLQGWRDEQGSWQVPLINKIMILAMNMVAIDQPAPAQAIHSVYKLSSTSQTMKFLHATLRFPTKTAVVVT